MRKVAERLGVGTMSLYTYVPGKTELIDLMLDATAVPPSAAARGDDEGPRGDDAASRGGDMAARADRAPSHGGDMARADRGPSHGGGWRKRLEQIARDGWERYHRHPWLLEITMVRPVLGPNVIARYDYELQAVDGIGLTDVEMDAVITLIAGHVEGTARRALEAEFAERRTGQSDEDWWAERAPFLERVFEPDRFPTAARVGAAAGEAHNAAYAPEHTLWFGLQRILDGIEALVVSRSSAG